MIKDAVSALNDGDVLTVTGSKTNASGELYLNIPAGAKVVWNAYFKSLDNGIGVNGEGSFESTAGKLDIEGLYTEGKVTATLNGDIIFWADDAFGSGAWDESKLIINGDLTFTGNGQLWTESDGNVTVNGSINLEGDYSFVCSKNNNSSGLAVITVNGNVDVSGDGSYVGAAYGGVVVINGELTTLDDDEYVKIDGVWFAIDEHETVSSRAGYLEYTDGTSSVFVSVMTEIRTFDDLMAISTDSMTLGGYYVLMNDITFTEQNNIDFVPIGSPFTGTFDGQGFTIDGLDVNASEFAGLFGYADGATIKNLTVKGDIAAAGTGGWIYAGGIVGDMYETEITNCHFDGNVSAAGTGDAAFAGGIAGWSYLSKIIGCSNTGSVTATSETDQAGAGGIVGWANSTEIIDCYNTGPVSAATETPVAYAGGIVSGMNETEIIDCYNTGPITAGGDTGDAFAGGIAGWTNEYEITGCYNTGPVSAATDSYEAYAGGIAGYARYVTITDCYNEGQIEATEDDGGALAGGIAGHVYYVTITDCYNTGSVTGYVLAGGIAGYIGYSEITGCYNTGPITAEAGSSQSEAGGIAGYAYNTDISDCYNTGSVSGTSNGGDVSLGGIAGYTYGSRIERCFNSGSVTANNLGTGTGELWAGAGGIAGQVYTTEITDCYNTGAVASYGASWADAGGIVGYTDSVTINNCYNIGTVTAAGAGDTNAGGIAGYIALGGGTLNIVEINFSFSLQGTVSGVEEILGIAGIVNGEAGTLSFDGGETDPVVSGAYSVADMRTQATYEGWDFDYVWDIAADKNNGFPMLRGMPYADPAVYSVTVTGANTNGSSPTTVTHGVIDAEITVLPAAGYTITGIGNVSMGGELLVIDVDYEADGNMVTIFFVTGEVIIAAAATPVSYTVTVTGANTNGSAPATVLHDATNVAIKVLPAAGYTITGIGNVSMGSELLVITEDYTVSGDTVTIFLITGAVTIAATAAATDVGGGEGGDEGNNTMMIAAIAVAVIAVIGVAAYFLVIRKP